MGTLLSSVHVTTDLLDGSHDVSWRTTWLVMSVLYRKSVAWMMDHAGERVEIHLDKGRQWVLLFAGESDTPKCLNGCKTNKPQCARKLGHCSVVAAG